MPPLFDGETVTVGTLLAPAGVGIPVEPDGWGAFCGDVDVVYRRTLINSRRRLARVSRRWCHIGRWQRRRPVPDDRS